MSILIKGMEMPISCARCRCARGCPAINDRVVRMDEHPWFPHDHRHEDCPLVPVPPHGRLIDADALTKRILEEHDKFDAMNQYDSGLRAGYRASTKAIRLTPTIIEAEEGEA